MESPVDVLTQHFCLRWNNYQANMTSVFHQLLQMEAFVDVTLACHNASLRAHKVVLSACSPYFQQLLIDNPCQHPVIIMPHEVSFLDLQFILEFVYRGEVDVAQEQLPSLLRTAERLKIKGLCEVAAKEISTAPRRSYPKIKFSTFSNKRRCMMDHHTPPHTISGKYDFPVSEHGPCHNGLTTQHDQSIVDDDHELMNAESKLPNNYDEPKRQAEEIQQEPKTTEVDEPEQSTPLEAEDELTPQRKATYDLKGDDSGAGLDSDSRHSDDNKSCVDDEDHHSMMITPELLGLMPTANLHSDDSVDSSPTKSNKHWSQEDMDMALEALRTQSMNLTKASTTFGIPSTTLWQRAHRLGISTPKKDSQAKTWSEADLNLALDELRAGRISANRASKTFHIPSSTLYKIARKEGIKLAAPFNASPTAWCTEDLNKALEAIRNGVSVQKAASEYGIPSGTLYGRCKREGIELCKNTPVPWSPTNMNNAIDAVRHGEMSINQAAINFNLPYSSLYGRFKRVKTEDPHTKLDFEMFN